MTDIHLLADRGDFIAGERFGALRQLMSAGGDFPSGVIPLRSQDNKHCRVERCGSGRFHGVTLATRSGNSSLAGDGRRDGGKPVFQDDKDRYGWFGLTGKVFCGL